MKVKKATPLDIAISFLGLLVVILAVEIRLPSNVTAILLQAGMACTAVALTVLVYRRVG